MSAKDPVVLEGHEYVTKDSGTRVVMPSGAVKEDGSNKGRFDLIPTEALRRWAMLLQRGAIKYGERNYEKGTPFHRFIDSAMRHLIQFQEGEETEDHLAAVLFNIGALIHHQKGIEDGKLDPALDDRPIGKVEIKVEQPEVKIAIEPIDIKAAIERLKKQQETEAEQPRTWPWPNRDYHPPGCCNPTFDPNLVYGPGRS